VTARPAQGRTLFYHRDSEGKAECAPPQYVVWAQKRAGELGVTFDGTPERIQAMMQAAGVAEALRFTAALTDGARVWAFRWASDNRPATLYWRAEGAALTIVSEPIDADRGGWEAVPQDAVLSAVPGEAVAVGALMAAG